MSVPYWPQTAVIHDHLDGSLPLLNILPDLFRRTHGNTQKYPFNLWVNHREQVVSWFADVHRDLVEKFSITTGVMQSYDTLTFAAYTYTVMRARQGFRYCEAAIAPQYHTSMGLTEKEVVAALIKGIRIGEIEDPRIEVNLVYTIGREVSSDEAIRLVEIAAECTNREYIPVIGLACDEAAHPPEKHLAMFKKAKELGFKTTCHAGEWVSEDKDFQRDKEGLLRNIKTAVYDLGVDRLDHAVALAHDYALVQEVVNRNIPVTGCPCSNLATGAINDIKELRIRQLLDRGVLYSLNPDDDLFLPTLDETAQAYQDAYRSSNEYEQELLKTEKQKLLRNPWLSRFGNRKNHPELNSI